MLESNYVAFWIGNLILRLHLEPCSLSFTPMNLFQQIDFSMCRRIPSEHTQTKWKCTSSFFGLPSCLLLSYTPSEFFRKAALQRLPVSLLSLRARFLVILLKVYSCRATFEANPVPLDQAFSVCMALRTDIKDKRRLVEPLYWFLKAAGPPRCVVVQSRCSLSTKKIQAPNLRWWYLSGPTIT